MWTDKQAKRFYNSKEWKAKRVEILTRDNFECQDCRTRLKEASKKGIQLRGKDRYIARGVEVHHIKDLKEYPQLRLDDDNLISLCNFCHNLRHGRTGKSFNQVKKEYISEEKW